MRFQMEIDEYLKRIEVEQPKNGATKEYLNQLHIGHLTHIPFETFDLIDLKQLNISIDHVFERIVRQNRGGVCYQMNGLFAYILGKLGYHVQYVPCGVYMLDKKIYHSIHSHVSLCVTLENDEKMLCDVGFSRDYLTPLYFRTDCVQFALDGFFRLIKSEDGKFYHLERGFLETNQSISLPSPSTRSTHIVDIDPEKIKWVGSYRFPINFDELNLKLEDFESACSSTLHSPDVRLNHLTICRIEVFEPFIGARGIIGKTYSEWTFENGIETRTDMQLSDDNQDELKKILKEKFHLDIDRTIHLVE